MSVRDQGWSSLPSLHLPTFIPPSPLLPSWCLDSVISEVFSSLNSSVILLHILAQVQLRNASPHPRDTPCTSAAEVTQDLGEGSQRAQNSKPAPAAVTILCESLSPWPRAVTSPEQHLAHRLSSLCSFHKTQEKIVCLLSHRSLEVVAQLMDIRALPWTHFL